METFKEKFQIEKLEIAQIGSWIISLRPQQVTLGSLVLSLNRECTSLGELLEIEGKELRMAFKTIEFILKKSFQPEKINYLALMMVDNHVHFHVIPRYSETRIFNEREYIDKDWPKPPILSTSHNLKVDDLISIKDELVRISK